MGIKKIYKNNSGETYEAKVLYANAGGTTLEVFNGFKSLKDCTWAEISAISALGEARNHFYIGEEKTILVKGTVGTLSVDQYFKAMIIGFNHNSAVEGSGITFQLFRTADEVDVALVDSKYNATGGNDGSKYFAVNHWGSSSSPYNNNNGGWAACDLRYDILGSVDVAPSPYGSAKTGSATGSDATSTCATSPVANTLMAALPSDLRAVMKPITKWTDNYGYGLGTEAKVTATVDYLPLLSEYELFGARTYANQYEQNKQAQYEYYADGGSAVRYKHNNTSSSNTCYWWLRSPAVADSDRARFCSVSASGLPNRNQTRYSEGIAPIFLV